MELNNDERIDDLEFKGLKIIQNANGFCFGIDSVLLSDFAKNIKDNCTVLDLGTGTGIIPILLCGKTNLKEVIGVEVQEEVANMAKRSSMLNNLENRFKVLNDNILNLGKYYKNQTFDVITTNPPYKEKDTGVINEDKRKLISRNEITASLEDFIILIGKKLLNEIFTPDAIALNRLIFVEGYNNSELLDTFKVSCIDKTLFYFSKYLETYAKKEKINIDDIQETSRICVDLLISHHLLDSLLDSNYVPPSEEEIDKIAKKATKIFLLYLNHNKEIQWISMMNS